jgi:predicted nucleic acid-binding protein
VSKVVLNSSVIIALSMLGYLDKLKQIFKEILIAKAVYEEICIKGRGLIGERELLEAVKNNIIIVKDVKNRLLVNALLDPLAMGEAETITLASEEKADYIVIDDKLARRRAKSMKLNVIGTLRILRLMYDAKLIDKRETIKALEKLKETGFRISEDIANRVLRGL